MPCRHQTSIHLVKWILRNRSESSLPFHYHLLLKNIMVTYVNTKSVLGWERHNVSTSKEEFVYRKPLQKRNRRINIQKT